MRTCLIYCGQARTVADTWENHGWYLRHLPNPTVFVSVSDDEQAEGMKLLKEAFPSAPFFMEKVRQPDDIPEPIARTRYHSGYPPSSPPIFILKQLWALNRAWQFVCEKGGDTTHDLFVRVRPDIAFCRTEFRWQHYSAPNRAPDSLKGSLSYDLRRNLACDIPTWCCAPRWSKWGGLNDRFALLGRAAAESYFTTFQKRERLCSPERGPRCPLHPEQMIAASLEMDGIRIDASGRFEFVTSRLPTPEHPKGGYFPCDVSAIDVMDQIR